MALASHDKGQDLSSQLLSDFVTTLYKYATGRRERDKPTTPDNATANNYYMLDQLAGEIRAVVASATQGFVFLNIPPKVITLSHARRVVFADLKDCTSRINSPVEKTQQKPATIKDNCY